MTLRGTPFLYAGEELGLEDAVIAPERVVDPGGRDGCRAPIPWTASPDHGWSSEPWLPFVERAAEVSVDAQMVDEGSMLHFARTVLDLRRRTPVLRSGALAGLHVEGEVLVFDRVGDDGRLRVMINFSADGDVATPHRRPLLSSRADHRSGVLRAREAIVFEVPDDRASLTL